MAHNSTKAKADTQQFLTDSDFFDNVALCDVQVHFSGTYLHAHKYQLAKYSPWFFQAFTSAFPVSPLLKSLSQDPHSHKHRWPPATLSTSAPTTPLASSSPYSATSTPSPTSKSSTIPATTSLKFPAHQPLQLLPRLQPRNVYLGR
ncbi:hypothetical protein KCU85_g9057, partial [Aureobasidium melanogenum]